MTGPGRGSGRGAAPRPDSADNQRDVPIGTDGTPRRRSASTTEILADLRQARAVIDAALDGRLPAVVAVLELARRARALERIVLAAEVVEVAS